MSKIYFWTFWVKILIILTLIEGPSGQDQRFTYEKSDFRINPRQSAENEPGLPSNLPSPPKPPQAQAASSGSFGRQNGGQQQNGAGSLFTRLPQLPPPHVGPDGAPIGPPGGSGFFGGFGHGPAFGLAHTLLILVPQFKVKIQGLPKWLGSNVKYSFPITVFFDKMSFPPPPPNPENPFDFLGLPPPAIHFADFFKAHKLHKRAADFEKKPHQIIGGERSLFITKISSILDSIGIEPNCLLRFICEIHQSPLHTHLGLLGETLTTLFSVSKSSFAGALLPEYLLAEKSGKFIQNCSNYTKLCTESLFH